MIPACMYFKSPPLYSENRPSIIELHLNTLTFKLSVIGRRLDSVGRPDNAKVHLHIVDKDLRSPRPLSDLSLKIYNWNDSYDEMITPGADPGIL